MNKSFILFLIIVIVGCLPGVSSDIYAPLLLIISQDLNTNLYYVQWSMAIFMLGLSVSQLIYGPLSEAFGRKFVLIIGLSISIMGSIMCIIAPSIKILIAGRFLQGIGLGACASMWRSIFRDQFEGVDMAKYASYLSVFMIIVVPAAPTLGGYLQEYFGWRSSFMFIFSYGCLALLSVFFFYKETNKHHHKSKLKLSFIIKTYKEVLSNRAFMGFSLCTFLSYGAFFSWYNTGPILLIKGSNLTPVEFGWFTFFAGGVSMAIASFLNAHFVKKLGISFMIRIGWSLMIGAGILLFSLYFMMGVKFIAIAIPFILFYFGSTFIWPCCFSGAFQSLDKVAGYAGCIYGSMQIGGAALIGSLVSYLPNSNQIPLSMVFISCSSLAWIVFELVIKKRIEL